VLRGKRKELSGKRLEVKKFRELRRFSYLNSEPPITIGINFSTAKRLNLFSTAKH